MSHRISYAAEMAAVFLLGRKSPSLLAGEDHGMRPLQKATRDLEAGLTVVTPREGSSSCMQPLARRGEQLVIFYI